MRGRKIKRKFKRSVKLSIRISREHVNLLSEIIGGYESQIVSMSDIIEDGIECIGAEHGIYVHKELILSDKIGIN